jgi:hypothetical protein
MKSVDHDNNGFIDYNEFIMCAIDKKILLGEQQLKNIFKKIDIVLLLLLFLIILLSFKLIIIHYYSLLIFFYFIIIHYK